MALSGHKGLKKGVFLDQAVQVWALAKPHVQQPQTQDHVSKHSVC